MYTKIGFTSIFDYLYIWYTIYRAVWGDVIPLLFSWDTNTITIDKKKQYI